MTKLIWIGAGAFIGTLALLFLALVGAAKYYASGADIPELAKSSVFARSTDAHEIRLIDSGIASLGERLDVIASAKKSLELEFFIYNVDEASRILTQALVKKAREGVDVRILVDFSAPVFQLKPVYARFLQSYGVKVKYYNTTPLYRVFSAQHRSHRKLLIADGQTVVTGGRNIGDDYFDLSHHYNFLDSDVAIRGPIVAKVRESFDLYWNSPLAREADTPAADGADEAKATDFFLPTASDQLVLETLKSRKDELLKRAPAFDCRDLTFVTDFPEKGEVHRKVFSTIVEIMKEARKEVWVESPYFVIKGDGYDVLKSVEAQGAQIKVLTNSLASTDAFYTVAALYPNVSWLKDSGIEIYAYDGSQPTGAQAALLPSSERWGVHSKRAVVDGQTILIGTYNVDPRSANLNSELMFACRGNAELAQAMRESITGRASRAKAVIDERGEINTDALLGETTGGQRFPFWIAMPFANLFDFLL